MVGRDPEGLSQPGWSWVPVNPSLAEGLQEGPSRSRAEPRAMRIDRQNPKLHHPVLWLSFVSVQ